MSIIEAWVGQVPDIHVFVHYVQLKPGWLILIVSIVSIIAGILLRRYLPRQKILAIFFPLGVFLGTEYVVAKQEAPNVALVVLGSCSALLGLGVTIPSVLMHWNKRTVED